MVFMVASAEHSPDLLQLPLSNFLLFLCGLIPLGLLCYPMLIVFRLRSEQSNQNSEEKFNGSSSSAQVLDEFAELKERSYSHGAIAEEDFMAAMMAPTKKMQQQQQQIAEAENFGIRNRKSSTLASSGTSASTSPLSSHLSAMTSNHALDEDNCPRSSTSSTTSSVADSNTSSEIDSSVGDTSKVQWSSGVAFNPNPHYWRIGGVWYDFTKFAKRHPGGEEIVFLARDRFDDATYAFESHHTDYKKVRKIITKFAVSDELQETLTAANHMDEAPAHLLGDDSFYSDLRRRVTAHFVDNKISTGPTNASMTIWWVCFASWVASVATTLYTASFFSALVQGIFAGLIGAFGHNWIHQPKYKWLGYLSLDTIGFSSDGWYRDHVLQHHMFTNTPLDNHFKGTDPFLVTDPTVERHWFQKYVTPYLNPIVLMFGIWGNYITHLSELLVGREKFSIMKLFFPATVATFIYVHGPALGMALMVTQSGFTGIWYFTMALMNHNAEHCHDVESRNETKDWGESQLHACADWASDAPFWKSSVFLWLNYHTIHHLFPLVDFSHHKDLQAILIQCAKDHKVEYVIGDFFQIYKDMITNFSNPTALGQEVFSYQG
jgi:fatty acid desaturase